MIVVLASFGGSRSSCERMLQQSEFELQSSKHIRPLRKDQDAGLDAVKHSPSKAYSTPPV